MKKHWAEIPLWLLVLFALGGVVFAIVRFWPQDW